MDRQTDKRTDRRTDRITITKTVLRIASHGKNYILLMCFTFMHLCWQIAITHAIYYKCRLSVSQIIFDVTTSICIFCDIDNMWVRKTESCIVTQTLMSSIWLCDRIFLRCSSLISRYDTLSFFSKAFSTPANAALNVSCITRWQETMQTCTHDIVERLFTVQSLMYWNCDIKLNVQPHWKRIDAELGIQIICLTLSGFSSWRYVVAVTLMVH